MRVSEFFIKKGTKFRDKNVHDNKSVHPDDLKVAVDKLTASGKDYISILRFVDYEYGPDAKSYVKRYLSGNVNEECWALPDSDKKLAAFKTIMSNPLPANRASEALYHIIGTSDFHDLLNTLAEEDPTQDVRNAIEKFISVSMPEIDNYFKPEDDCVEYNNIEGILSPLGHEFEHNKC